MTTNENTTHELDAKDDAVMNEESARGFDADDAYDESVSYDAEEASYDDNALAIDDDGPDDADDLAYPSDGDDTHGECETHEMLSHNQALGRKGEDAAVAFLVRQGFEIVERNWRCKFGEADIIAIDDTALHFVEVKTRMSVGAGFPGEAVTPDKRRRYEIIAEMYLRENHVPGDIFVTFDVIAIIVTGPDHAFLRFHRNVLTRDGAR